jgi:HK97 gp10 family phage protein
MSQYRPSYDGIGQMLVAKFMQAEMLRRAEKVKAAAEATAPDAPPIGEGYKYDFHASAGIKRSKDGKRRAVGRVTNDSDHAVFVEYGGQNTPAHRTLGRALNAAKD